MNERNYIYCAVCGKRLRVVGTHLNRIHGMSVSSYLTKFPNALTSCKEAEQLKVSSAKRTCLTRYGVSNPMRIKSVASKARKTRKVNNHEKYGVVNVMQIPEVAKKQHKTYLKTLATRYGVKNMHQIPSAKVKFEKTVRERFGVNHPMQSPDVLRKTFKSKQTGPNRPEQLIIDLDVPNLKYVGNGKFFVLGRNKTRNPDFIVKGQPKVVEHFGSYDHGPLRTGMSRSLHEKEVISFYRDAGYRCLVIWDCTKYNLAEVKNKLTSFINESF